MKDIVFSGDWNGYESSDPNDYDTRYSEGYTGRPASQWAGGEEFFVSREVMGAIIDRQIVSRQEHYASLIAAGWAPDAAAKDTDQALHPLYWGPDGVIVVHDQRVAADDSRAMEYTLPDRNGEYRAAFGWSFHQVASEWCDLIHGAMARYAQPAH